MSLAACATLPEHGARALHSSLISSPTRVTRRDRTAGDNDAFASISSQAE